MLSESLARAQRDREKDVSAAAVQLYDTVFYVEQLSGVPSSTISAPTSTEKVKNISIEAAAQNASKTVDNLAAAFIEGHFTASKPTASEICTTSEPFPASTPPVQPKRKRNRRDVLAARRIVASGTLLESRQISKLSDTLATVYQRSLRLSVNGNRDAKRQRLHDYFRVHTMESYFPSVDQGMGEPAGARAAVEAGAKSGTRVDAGLGVGADAGAGAGAGTGAVAEVDSVQSARSHGVGSIAASREENSSEGLKSI